MNTIKILAATEAKVLKLSKRDQPKCKGLIIATRAAALSGDKHLANTAHWVRSRRDGFNHIDRLGSLSNAIAKFSKMRPEALTGGAKLKEALLDRAWIAYAKLEVDGLDNAHFTETCIPCQVDGSEIADDDTHGFNDPCYKASEAACA